MSTPQNKLIRLSIELEEQDESENLPVLTFICDNKNECNQKFAIFISQFCFLMHFNVTYRHGMQERTNKQTNERKVSPSFDSYLQPISLKLHTMLTVTVRMKAEWDWERKRDSRNAAVSSLWLTEYELFKHYSMFVYSYQC